MSPLSVLSVRRVLAFVAALSGLLASVSGSPYPAKRDDVDPIELAGWLRAHKPGLRVIDLRARDDYERHHLPQSEPQTVASLATAPIESTQTLVLVSTDGTGDTRSARAMLAAFGITEVYVLKGGMNGWMDDVLSPTIASDASPEALAAFRRASEVSRYFGGVPRIVDPHEPMPRPPDAVAKSRVIGRRGC